MFTKLTPKTDSQLSNSDVANLIVADALDKLTQLTGLDQQDALLLLAEQITPSTEKPATRQHPQAVEVILEQNEYQFISGLFS